LAKENNSNAARGPAAPLADPVPEPSTWVMMLVGLAELGFVGLRSRARAAEGHF
jgi:hypothetical protein